MAAGVAVAIVGAAATAAWLRQKADDADKVHGLAVHYGALMQADARARARRLFDTTDYDDSIRMRVAGRGRKTTVAVYSDAPQAHRLEYGFTGVDKAGRRYHQPPRPHMRPAFARYAPQFRQAVEDLLK